MKAKILLIGLGIVIFAFGIIFYLQGNSVVGPTSSFMYSNPKWIHYGKIIALIGGAIIVIGIWLSLRRPR